MPIRSPYTRQLSSYSPQRSAGIGRPAVLPREYGLGFRGSAVNAPVVKPPTTVEDMIYAGPSEPMSPLEGGGPPGLAGEGLEGTTDPGEQASNASILGLNPVGFMMGKGNPLGTIVGMAGRGLNSALGNPLGQFGGWLGDQIGNISPSLANALGVGHSMSSGMEGGVPAAQGFIGGDTHGGWGKGQSSESIAPPPSDLADIGIGGGVSGGGLFGGPGPSGDSGDAGVAAGIAVGFGGGDW